MWIRPYNLFMSLWYVEFVFARPRFLLARVSFSFLPKRGGGQNEIVWVIGGQVHIRVQSMWQTRGVRGYARP